MKDFQELLRRAVTTFGSQTALGKAIDVSPSRISRVLKGEEDASLEVINCLKLAEATGEAPSDVLRAAGKTDVADIIERLYGSSRPAAPAMRKGDRELLDRLAVIPRDARESINLILRRLAADSARAKE